MAKLRNAITILLVKILLTNCKNIPVGGYGSGALCECLN